MLSFGIPVGLAQIEQVKELVLYLFQNFGWPEVTLINISTKTAWQQKAVHAKYIMIQAFRQAKSANGGSILSSSQFMILPQLPQKMKLASKVVKVDSKIIILLPKI